MIDIRCLLVVGQRVSRGGALSWLSAIGLLGLCAFFLSLSLCAPTAIAQAPLPALPVTVTVDTENPGRPVPERFLGLSFELAALSQLAQYSEKGNLVALLRSLGPGLLRFGGITADENVAYVDPFRPRPAWASATIDAADLHALGVLARRSGWKVMLTVGLAHFEPEVAAREVAAAHRALGPYLAAVEIGNEPDAYGRHGFRELPWIAQGYEENVSTYREAIETLTPDAPIAGPDVSGSGAFPEWGEEEALSQRPALLTGHHYPLGCMQKPAPTIEQLLSAAIRGRESQSLATYTRVARRYGIPVRVDETNSVSCGGEQGISNTFASTLWATSYITQAMAAGTVGVNLQGNPANCAGYTPLCAPGPQALTEGSLRAQPEWYALLLTKSLIADRPLLTTTSAEGSPDLATASFEGHAHQLQVVLVDGESPGSHPLSVRLNLDPRMSVAKVLRLRAPSPSATSGIELGSSSASAKGGFTSPPRTESVAVHNGLVEVELAPSSAALLTVGTAGKP